jgi:hypothetical protein
VAQLDDGNDRAILVQGDEGSAQVIRLGHRGTPSLDAATKLSFFATRPIASIGPAHRILRYLSKKDESPKVEPEAVAAGFEGKRNPPDIAAGSGFGTGLPLRAWRAFRFRRTAASRISRVPSWRPHDSLRSSQHSEP